MDLPYGQTITILRRPSRNNVGDPVGDDASHTINNVGVAWEYTTENTNFRESTVSSATLYVPRGADILASDRVELEDGSLWNVVGRPLWDQNHPMTGTNFGYMQVHIQEVS